MWLKEHKKSLIAGIAVLAVLLFAFWYGSGSPATQGGGESVSSSVSTSAESSADSSAAQSAQSDASAQTAPDQKTEQEQPQQKPEAKPEKKPEQKPVVKPVEKPAVKPEQKPVEKPAVKPQPKPETKPEKKPEQKPAVKPVEKPEVKPEPEVLTCKLSIRCDTILNHMDWLTPGKEKLVPRDGVLYAMKTVEFEEGETVFDVLLRETKKAKLHMEFSNSAVYDSAYVEGIGNLYEFDCGNLSGWMYKVNNVFPQYGCSQYKLKKGDVIEWEYTCELGDDIGGGQSVG